MRFLSLYRISFYLMLFLATLTMSADVSEHPIARLFPVAVAVSGIVAFATVDRNPALGLSRSTANTLALGSIGLVLLEYLLDPTQLLLSLAHFLVYLQLVKVFLPKSSEDDWFLFLLGMMQVLVGAVFSQADHVGLLLFCWAFLSIWVLALFSLHRDARRSLASDGAGGEAAPMPADDEPYPGLMDFPFVLSALRVMGLTLALGGIIFLAMPRQGAAQRSPHGSDPMARHLTGFDDEVQLGQLGEILENDSVVMSVEFYDANQTPIRPPGEPLWRGVTMSVYDRGRWHRQRRAPSSFPIVRERARTVRQQIKLEANDTRVLFGLRPMLDAHGTNTEIELNSIDGTVARQGGRVGTFDYEVISDTDPDAIQPGEKLPEPRQVASLLKVPDPLRDRLAALAEPILRDIPAADVVGRGRALEAHFRDSGRFTYTLRMSVVDPGLDPVEDFIVNRREGHCEYFASAVTLMLRAAGIPARIVNGFKGGDWNQITQVMNVRQKHAHSWVEALVGEREDEMGKAPVWLTLDPTPPGERLLSVDGVGGLTSHFRQFTDLVRYVWIFFVVGYNAERQNRLIYEPVRELVRLARNGFALMGQAFRPTLARLLHFQDVGQFISIRGFLVSFTALLLLAGLFRGLRWVVRRVWNWFRGRDQDESSLPAGVVFYRRLTQLLAEFGLERPPAETQSEFAQRAGVFLTGRGSDVEPVADVPAEVVEAFYRVRFGDLALSADDFRAMEARLDALEASLRASQT